MKTFFVYNSIDYCDKNIYFPAIHFQHDIKLAHPKTSLYLFLPLFHSDIYLVEK